MTTETTPLDEKIIYNHTQGYAFEEDIKTAIQNLERIFYNLTTCLGCSEEYNRAFIQARKNLFEAILKSFGKSFVETIPNYTNEKTNNSFSDKTILQKTSPIIMEKREFESHLNLNEKSSIDTSNSTNLSNLDVSSSGLRHSDNQKTEDDCGCDTACRTFCEKHYKEMYGGGSEE